MVIVDRTESPSLNQENINPIPVPGPVTRMDNALLLRILSNNDEDVGGQRCCPRKPLADMKIAIGRMVPTGLAKQTRVRLQLESNRQARREARRCLIEHGRRIPFELPDTDSESEAESSSDRDGGSQDPESGNVTDSGYHYLRGGSFLSPEV